MQVQSIADKENIPVNILTPINSTKTPITPTTKHTDPVFCSNVVNSDPRFTSDLIQLSTCSPSLIHKLKQNPENPELWRSVLANDYQAYLKAIQNEDTDRVQQLRSNLTKLFNKATKYIPSQKYRNNIAYQEIWLNKVYFQGELNNRLDAKESINFMKSQRIASRCAKFYIIWAQIELKKPNKNKATIVLERGRMKDGLDDLELLEKARRMLVEGTLEKMEILPIFTDRTNAIASREPLKERVIQQSTNAKNHDSEIVLKEISKQKETEAKHLPTQSAPNSISHSMDDDATVYAPVKNDDNKLLASLLNRNLRRKTQPIQGQQIPAAQIDQTPTLKVSEARKRKARREVPMTPLSERDNVMVNGIVYTKIGGAIGRGGSSKVYKVLSSKDKQIYALKKVRLRGLPKSAIKGFLNEVTLLKSLKGKEFIIQYIDSEIRKDILYLVMECGDTDLNQLLRQHQGKSLNEIQIRAYWYQMLQAVNTIHEERIVHSDLKPANFLLVKGMLKLIDFGIAKAINNDTTNIMRETSVGTVNYMSPEALLDRSSHNPGNATPQYKMGRPSDIWSLGCILYQMVYGSTPFAGIKNMIVKIKAITDDKYTIPLPDIPNKHLLDVLRSTLKRNAKERPTIPQLLQHPFLQAPSVNPTASSSDQKTVTVLQAQLGRLCRFACSFVEDEKLRKQFAEKLQELLEQKQEISGLLHEIAQN